MANSDSWAEAEDFNGWEQYSVLADEPCDMPSSVSGEVQTGGATTATTATTATATTATKKATKKETAKEGLEAKLDDMAKWFSDSPLRRERKAIERAEEREVMKRIRGAGDNPSDVIARLASFENAQLADLGSPVVQDYLFGLADGSSDA